MRSVITPVKQILLLIILSFIPAAHAVDYVQCEAMQKALIRLRNSREDAAHNARVQSYGPFNLEEKAATNREYLAECRRKFPDDWIRCVVNMVGKEDEPKRIKGRAIADAVRAEWAPRIAKVEADYAAAGCY